MDQIQQVQVRDHGGLSAAGGLHRHRNGLWEPQELLWDGSLGQEGSPGLGQLSPREGTGSSEPWEADRGKLVCLWLFHPKVLRDQLATEQLL